METESLVDNEFKIKITDAVQFILDNNFISGPKTKIKGMHDRINFACPYCGDSVTDVTKKRGNLFWNTLMFHCYNAGCNTHKALHDFLKEYNVTEVSGNDRIAIINYIKSTVGNHVRTTELEFELFLKLKELSIPRVKFYEMTDSRPIVKNGPGYDILRERILVHKVEEFSYSKNRLFILNLTADRQNVIGYQIRKLNATSKNKYLTYNIESMLRKCNVDLSEYEPQLLDKLNKLSTLFNILKVDFTRDVTAFEGPIDSMFMSNTIGQASISRDMEMFSDIPTIRYFYDNDKTGLDEARTQIKMGHKVFLWHKFLKDENLIQYKGKEKLKDLNDIIMLCFKYKLDAYKKLNDYFSNNAIDMFFI